MKILLINIVLVLAFFSAKASETFYKISEEDVSEVNKLYDSLGGENWYNREGWPVSSGSFSVDYLPDGIRLELGEVISSHTVSIVYLANISEIDLSENNLRGMIPVLEMEFLEKLDVSSNSFSFEHLEANAGGVEDYFYSPQDTTYNLEIIGNTATVLVSGQQLVYDWFVDDELKVGTNSPEYRIVPNEIIKCRVRSLLLPGLELWSEEFGEIIEKEIFYQITQKEADELNKLYYQTNGEKWINKFNWPVKDEYFKYGEVNYTGLKIKHTDFVLYEDSYIIVYQAVTTSIKFLENGLVGTLPNFDLPNLEVLYFGSTRQKDEIEGSIPNFNLPRLEELVLHNLKLTGEIPALNLPSLKTLILSANQLTGEIPDFNMPLLEGISLSSNQLTGEIPNYNFPKLKHLFLNNNQLTGSIPKFSLPRLEVLVLDENELTGSIPNFSYPELVQLYLNGNQLTGTIPNFDMPNLTRIYLEINELSGSIPEFELTNLKQLGLNNNRLSGSIPKFNFPVGADLLLNNNKFTFGSLEVNSISLMAYTYRGQDTTLPISQIGRKIVVNVDGTQNSYKWFLDSNEVQTTSVNYYTLTEDGVYYCEVRNSLLPGLTLSSGTISVVNTGIENMKSGDKNVRITQTNEILSVHSNGDYLGSEIRIFDNIGEIIYFGEMLNSDESVDISGFASGGYTFVLIKNNEMIKSKKFIIGK
jgi:uncharacterized protein YjbI with pentapeptide repeats